MKSIQFIQTSPEDLKESILSDLEGAIKDIAKQFITKKPEELMTRKQVADYFHISLVTLWNWTKEGKLKGYAISNKIYYKRSEIEQVLTEI